MRRLRERLGVNRLGGHVGWLAEIRGSGFELLLRYPHRGVFVLGLDRDLMGAVLENRDAELAHGSTFFGGIWNTQTKVSADVLARLPRLVDQRRIPFGAFLEQLLDKVGDAGF